MVQVKVTLLPEDRLIELEKRLDHMSRTLEQLSVSADTKNEKVYYRINEAAAYICMCRRSFEELRRQGFVPFSQHGKHIVIEKADLDQFVATRKLTKQR